MSVMVHGKLRPIEVPSTTKLPLSDLDAPMSSVMAHWIKKHGKTSKPKLSADQREELLQVFNLMDDDGSGELGVEELLSAFKLLGFNLSKSDILQMIAEVDDDGSGEVGYDEFLQIMTDSLVKLTQESADPSHQSKTPFALMATAYRRKKILENLLDVSGEGLTQVALLREEEESAKERERQTAYEAKISCSGAAKEGQSRYASMIGRASEVSSLSPEVMRGFLSNSEIKALGSLAAAKQDRQARPGCRRSSDLQVMRSMQQRAAPHLPQLAQRRHAPVVGSADSLYERQEPLSGACSERNLCNPEHKIRRHSMDAQHPMQLGQQGQLPLSPLNPHASMKARNSIEVVHLATYSLPLLRERTCRH